MSTPIFDLFKYINIWFESLGTNVQQILIRELWAIIFGFLHPTVQLDGVYVPTNTNRWFTLSFFNGLRKGPIRVLSGWRQIDDSIPQQLAEYKGRVEEQMKKLELAKSDNPFERCHQPVVSLLCNSFGLCEIGWEDGSENFIGYVSWCGNFIQFHSSSPSFASQIYKFVPF